MSARPTSIEMFLVNCPRALDHMEAGIPRDEERFAIGTAAHEFLWGAFHRIPMDEMHEILIRDGRPGVVDPSPPLTADAVMEGRLIAEAFLGQMKGQSDDGFAFPEGAVAERRFAYGWNWEPIEWAEGERAPTDSMCSTRIDLVYLSEVGDEEWSGTAINVLDYKSAWGTSEASLRTIQARFQAVVAWKAHPEADAVLVHRANLRTRKIYTRALYPGKEEDLAILEKWAKEIEINARATAKPDDGSPRPASPGPKCHGCFYVRRCPAAIDYVNDRGNDLLGRWAVVNAMFDELAPDVKTAVAESPAIVDGWEIGFLPQSESFVESGNTAKAVLEALEVYMDVTPQIAEAVGQIFSAKNKNGNSIETKGMITALAMALYPTSLRINKEPRESFITKYTAKETKPVLKTVRKASTLDRDGLPEGVTLDGTDDTEQRDATPVEIADWLPEGL